MSVHFNWEDHNVRFGGHVLELNLDDVVGLAQQHVQRRAARREARLAHAIPHERPYATAHWTDLHMVHARLSTQLLFHRVPSYNRRQWAAAATTRSRCRRRGTRWRDRDPPTAA